MGLIRKVDTDSQKIKGLHMNIVNSCVYSLYLYNSWWNALGIMRGDRNTNNLSWISEYSVIYSFQD